MFGSLAGNLIGILYFLAFQAGGIILTFLFLPKEKTGFNLWFGSVLGSFALHWLPTLLSFFLNFTKISHILALIVMGIIVAFFYTRKKNTLFHKENFRFSPAAWIKEEPVVFLLIPLFLFTAVCLTKHTLSPGEGLSMHAGQSTYGDMNMHLGFITSIARQQTFPPEYSILPGTRLAYPFLADSISSSLYIWGMSLRLAYLIPMYVALLHVFIGVYAATKQLLKKLSNHYRGKSILAFALFFFNGGLGFYYFINKGFGSENFTRIFTEFYQTPTNYVAANVQWHNIICDMLIPQRATLFGWAMLFPILTLLFKAREQKETTYFVISAILAGGLVLIHTHSFLALGICCAVFLLQDIVDTTGRKKIEFQSTTRLLMVTAFLAFMSVIGYCQQTQEPLSEKVIFTFGILLLVVYAAMLAYQLTSRKRKKEPFLASFLPWMIFLGIVLLCSLPQLFGFTFQQAQGEQFVRGGFNWANNNPEVADSYIIFYLKNLGIMFLLPILVLIFGSKDQRRIMMPGVFLWLICEFLIFQPNPYDNNKLLLVAYFFFCVGASDFVWENIPKLWKQNEQTIRKIVVSIVAFLGIFAALLTMGREYVSDYELYDDSYVNVAKWIDENTQPTDVILTAKNHNNAVASLSGRNIVCGSSTFLYFHGVNYYQQEQDVDVMYQEPSNRPALLKQYHVKYIVIGPYERNNFQIPDEAQMCDTYTPVYDDDETVILKVSDE